MWLKFPMEGEPDPAMSTRTASIPQAQSDWNESDSTRADFIKNKPDVVTQAQLATTTGMSAQQLAQLNTLLNALPTPRTNRPVVSGNYNLAETDLGVVLSTSGAVCNLPAYTSKQIGLPYLVKNGSLGSQTIQAAPGESFLVDGQAVSGIIFNPSLSRQLSRETTSQHWVID